MPDTCPAAETAETVRTKPSRSPPRASHGPVRGMEFLLYLCSSFERCSLVSGIEVFGHQRPEQ